MPQCPECHTELAGGETYCPQCRARLDGAAPIEAETGKTRDASPSRPPFRQVNIPPLQEFDMDDDMAYFTPPEGVTVNATPASRKPLFQDLDALDTLVSEPQANRGGWRSRWQEGATERGMASHIKVTVPRRLWRLRWLYLVAAFSTFLALGVGLGSLYWKPDEDEIQVDNYALATEYFEQGRYEVAQHLFGEAVKEQMVQPAPDMGPAFTMMGWSAYYAGEYPEASAYFGAAMSMDAEAADPQVGMGLAALAEGSLEEAETWLLGARDVDDDAPAVHRALGQLYLESGQVDAAIEELERAVELAPADYEALRWLGLAYQRNGNSERAITVLELAMAADATPEVMRTLIDAYLALGQHDAAVDIAERLRESEAENPEIEYLYGLTLLRADRLEEAQAVLDGIVEGPAGLLLEETYRALGLTLSNGEQYDVALEALDRALSIRPDDAHALELKGWALARLGRCADAVSVFERALEIDSGRQGAAEGLAACQSWLGHRRNAVRRQVERWMRGQGAIEYVLLIGLLLVVAISIWVLTGPGVGNVYRAIVPPAGSTPSATAIPDAALQEPAVSGVGAICTRFTVVGDAHILVETDEEVAPTLILGGRSDCSVVIEAGAGPTDPLVLDPVAKPARLQCAAIGDIHLTDSVFEDVERTFFSLNGEPVTLRIVSQTGGDAGEAVLFEATMQPDHVIVERNSVIIRGDLVSIQGDNRIDSPTLAAIQAAGAATWHLTLLPRGDAEDSRTPDFVDDRSSLGSFGGQSRLEVLTAACN